MLEQRKKLLAHWVGAQLDIAIPELCTVSGDASFRRYFRFPFEDKTFIAVDAPPAFENNAAFQMVAELLQQQNLLVPHILKIDLALGFLILTDLGNELYLTRLNQNRLNQSNANQLYSNAIDVIIQMLLIPQSKLNQLPLYDDKALNIEMDLFTEWLIKHHLKLELSTTEQQLIKHAFGILTENALTQSQHFVHRDFHSRNLMICGSNSPGIIDFQDAVLGPISYDLVSLFKDCYIQWSPEQVKHWCLEFYQKTTALNLMDVDFETFFKQFELMGMQRHIKVLGIFCRLNYRDNKPNYLEDLQLTFDYLLQAVAKYPEFNAFYQFLQHKVQPALIKPAGLQTNKHNIEH